jgi:hypothetical protein
MHDTEAERLIGVKRVGTRTGPFRIQTLRKPPGFILHEKAPRYLKPLPPSEGNSSHGTSFWLYIFTMHGSDGVLEHLRLGILVQRELPELSGFRIFGNHFRWKAQEPYDCNLKCCGAFELSEGSVFDAARLNVACAYVCNVPCVA